VDKYYFFITELDGRSRNRVQICNMSQWRKNQFCSVTRKRSLHNYAISRNCEGIQRRFGGTCCLQLHGRKPVLCYKMFISEEIVALLGCYTALIGSYRCFRTTYRSHLQGTSSKCYIFIGARGGAVAWGTALQVGRSRVRFLMVSLELFIDLILSVALGPWSRLSF
jgi:hypothetical protein